MSRYKIMVEDHFEGTVTQKQMTLEEISALMEPGTIAKGKIDKEVSFSKDPTEVGKIPANSRILSSGVEVKGPGHAKVMLDDKALVETNPKEQQVSKWGDAKPSEKEHTVNISGNGEGRARVIIAYETLN